MYSFYFFWGAILKRYVGQVFVSSCYCKYPVPFVVDWFEISFFEQFRFDFNQDGIENIFIRGWARAVGGTLVYGFTGYLTRYSEKGLIERIVIE